MTRPPSRTAIASLTVIGLLLATAASAVAVNPETNKKAGPADNAGYFLGYPTETYSWHGCTKTSTKQTPVTLDPGVPKPGKGTKQGKVTWTIETSSAATAGYVMHWKVAKGWRICGVQAAVRGSNANVDTDLAMEAGYTSKAAKGSTATTGRETIKVKVTKHDAQELGIPASYGGRKYAIDAIYGVTVFIKKKR